MDNKELKKQLSVVVDGKHERDQSFLVYWQGLVGLLFMGMPWNKSQKNSLVVSILRKVKVEFSSWHNGRNF